MKPIKTSHVPEFSRLDKNLFQTTKMCGRDPTQELERCASKERKSFLPNILRGKISLKKKSRWKRQVSLCCNRGVRTRMTEPATVVEHESFFWVPSVRHLTFTCSAAVWRRRGDGLLQRLQSIHSHKAKAERKKNHRPAPAFSSSFSKKKKGDTFAAEIFHFFKNCLTSRILRKINFGDNLIQLNWTRYANHWIDDMQISEMNAEKCGKISISFESRTAADEQMASGANENVFLFFSDSHE